jgi:hypothetical protein
MKGSVQQRIRAGIILAVFVLAWSIPQAGIAAEETGISSSTSSAGPRDGERYDYSLEGSLEVHSVFAHRRDSIVVADPAQRDTWRTSGYSEFLARHTFLAGSARVVLDHGVLIFSDPGLWIATGNAGTGSSAPADVALIHEMYEASVAVRVHPLVKVVAGRQFHWDGPRGRSPAGLHFSAIDGLHPCSASEETQTGFDGVRLVLGPDSPVTIAGALALQEALVSGGDSTPLEQKMRYGLSGWLTDGIGRRLGASTMIQHDRMLRYGLFAELPGERFSLGSEVALEMYDPRAEEITVNPLAGIRGEYRAELPRDVGVSLFGEYHYNGLESIYTGTAVAATQVTCDGAGGFQRPGAHYLRYGFTLEQRRRWRITNTFTNNLTDESVLGDHELTALAFEPVTFSLGIIWNSGYPTSEFGRLVEDFVVRLSAGIHF